MNRIGALMRIPVMLIVALLFAAPIARSQTTDPAPARPEITVPRTTAAAFSAAVAGGNADVIADLYVADATLFGPGAPPVAGRPNIRALWARNLAAGFTDLRFDDLGSDVGTDRAVVVWTWTLSAPATGQAVSGRSMVYLALTPDGWRISVDMWQPAP